MQDSDLLVMITNDWRPCLSRRFFNGYSVSTSLLLVLEVLSVSSGTSDESELSTLAEEESEEGSLSEGASVLFPLSLEVAESFEASLWLL